MKYSKIRGVYIYTENNIKIVEDRKYSTADSIIESIVGYTLGIKELEKEQQEHIDAKSKIQVINPTEKTMNGKLFRFHTLMINDLEDEIGILETCILKLQERLELK